MRSQSHHFTSWRCESGSAAIEFAFVGGLLIVLTIGIFELGRVVYTYQRTAEAVGLSTRLVERSLRDPSITEGDIEGVIRSNFSTVEQAALSVTIEGQIIDGVNYRRVEAQYNLPLILPGFKLISTRAIPVRSVQLIPID